MCGTMGETKVCKVQLEIETDSAEALRSALLTFLEGRLAVLIREDEREMRIEPSGRMDQVLNRVAQDIERAAKIRVVKDHIVSLKAAEIVVKQQERRETLTLPRF